MRETLRAARPCVVSCGERATRDQLGGKGFGLYELGMLGVPVPRWIALTTEAADIVLTPLRPRIDEIADTVSTGHAKAARWAAARIGQLVRGVPWPNWLRSELHAMVASLRAESGLAVRSSAVDEDGAEHSYAGQLETRLFVPAEDVEWAVRECWAAAYSENVILYRLARGMAGAPVRVAVVLQEMVDSRVSGVAFTADPGTGAPAHVVVAGYGLGEGVVSNLVETDSFRRDVDSDRWESTVWRKTRRVVRRGDGRAGTETAAVPAHERDRPAMTSEQLDSLSSMLHRIEKHGGSPQDVEWAIDDAGNLTILQARPITTAPAGDLTIWDDSNIAESYAGVTLPLTYSFVRGVYERVFGRAVREVGVTRRTIDSMRSALSHLVGIIRGRLFLNLTNFYRLFGVVPGFGGAVRKWELALGITQHVDAETPRREGAWRRAISRLLAVRTWFRLAVRFLRLDLEIVRFHHRVNALVTRYQNADFSRRSLDDLLETHERITKEFLDDWTVLIYNDLFAFLFDHRLARLCGGRGSDLHHQLLGGLGDIQSLAPLRSVQQLVQQARDEPAVLDLLRSDRAPEEVWRRLRENGVGAAFRAKVEEHLRMFGQRTIGELKLETKPLTDTPWELMSIVRNHLDLGLHLEDANGREEGVRQEAERAFRARLKRNPFTRLYAHWILWRTRQCVTDRENMSYARSHVYGLLRRLFQAVGSALTKVGALRAAEDVFYLTVADLESYARGGLPEAELALLVAMRRAQYALFANESVPHRIACRGSVYPHPIASAGAPAASQSRDTLQGVPCSPGVVRGNARVMRAPSPGERVDGEILVAPSTEPGWMFLMLAARGLVVERGSLLSHAAIIGRELGIPTVVGVEGVTSRICTGDEIELDGRTGQIRVLRRATSQLERRGAPSGSPPSPDGIRR